MIHQTMGTIVISHQKNGKNSVMNGVVKLRVQNMVIVLNVRIQRKDGTKNDLPLHAATDNLCYWRSDWEVVNKAMTPHQIYLMFGFLERIANAVETIAEVYKNPIELEYSARCAADELQHVSYDDAQLGREK